MTEVLARFTLLFLPTSFYYLKNRVFTLALFVHIFDFRYRFRVAVA